MESPSDAIDVGRLIWSSAAAVAVSATAVERAVDTATTIAVTCREIRMPSPPTPQRPSPGAGAEPNPGAGDAPRHSGQRFGSFRAIEKDCRWAPAPWAP